MEKVITKSHTTSLQVLSGFEHFEKLAGSSADAGGKMLVMKTIIDPEGFVINTFEVWSNTRAFDDRKVELNTRLLERAIEKYNSL